MRRVFLWGQECCCVVVQAFNGQLVHQRAFERIAQNALLEEPG